jgi:signal transduction histidine kinase
VDGPWDPTRGDRRLESQRIAHRFANVLTRLRGYTELAQRRLAPDDPARADLAEALRAVDEAIELVDQLRNAVRPEGAAPGDDDG